MLYCVADIVIVAVTILFALWLESVPGACPWLAPFEVIESILVLKNVSPQVLHIIRVYMEQDHV